MNTGKTFVFVAALAVALTTGCGNGGHGSGSTTNPPNPPQNDFAGAWQFVLTSAVYPAPSTATPPTGNVVFVEAIITQNGNNLTASGSQVQVFGWNEAQSDKLLAFAPNGACGQPNPGVNTITGTSTASDGKATQVAFTFNTGGVVYNATAFVNSDGTLTGTYTGGSGPCIGDVGVLSAAATSPLSGGYGGVLGSPYNSLTMNFNESSNYAVTVTGTPSVTLSGNAVGNSTLLTGTVNGFSASYLTFYDPTGTYTGATGPSVLIFDSASGTLYGLI